MNNDNNQTNYNNPNVNEQNNIMNQSQQPMPSQSNMNYNQNENKKPEPTIFIIIAVVVIIAAILVFVFLKNNNILSKNNNISTNNKELTEEEKLCQRINPYIEQYQSNILSYNELLSLIKNDYDNYCNNETNNICVSIKNMYQFEETDLELKDCSNLTGTYKDLCESTNNAKKEMAEKQERVQKAYVKNLAINCETSSNN